jgi:hypothetical protein
MLRGAHGKALVVPDCPGRKFSAIPETAYAATTILLWTVPTMLTDRKHSKGDSLDAWVHGRGSRRGYRRRRLGGLFEQQVIHHEQLVAHRSGVGHRVGQHPGRGLL